MCNWLGLYWHAYIGVSLCFYVSLFGLVCLHVSYGCVSVDVTWVHLRMHFCVCFTEKQSTGRQKAHQRRPKPGNTCASFIFHLHSVCEEPCVLFGFMKCWHPREERKCWLSIVKSRRPWRGAFCLLALVIPPAAAGTFHLPCWTIRPHSSSSAFLYSFVS